MANADTFDYEALTKQETDRDRGFSSKSPEDYQGDDFEDIKKKVTRLKQKYSNQYNKCMADGAKLEGDTPQNPRNQYNIHMYRSSVAQFKASYKVLMFYIEVLTALAEMDPRDDKTIKDAQEKEKDVETKWDDVQAKVALITTEDPSQAKSKNRSELQPNKLQASFTVYQHQQWESQWLQYRYFSKFDAESLEIQHSLLAANIEEDLHPILKPKFRDPSDKLIPIVAKDPTTRTCMTVIREHWDQSFPIMTRRMKYFQTEPEAGKPFSHYLNDLTRLAKEGDGYSMTNEEVFCFLAISKCKDEKTLEKLLEIKTLTKASLEEKVLEVEQLQRTQGAILKTELNAMKTPYRRNQEMNMSPSQGQNKQNAARKRLRDRLPEGYKDMCLCCGDKNPGHTYDKCPHKDNVNCADHPNKGHSDKACMKKIKQKLKEAKEAKEAKKADNETKSTKANEDKPATKVNTLKTTLNSVSIRDMDPGLFTAEFEDYD